LYELIVVGWLGYGVRAFVASLALALPATIVFARAFAAVFEAPSWRHRSLPGPLRRRYAEAKGAAA
jgi:hypothetical protein